MRRSGIVTRSFTASVARPAPAVVPVVISSRPTPQFVRHHDVAAPQVDATAFRQGWRIRSRLDGLLECGRIDREQWDAAIVWRRWNEVSSRSRAQHYEARVDVSAGPNDGGMGRRIDAASRLRAADAALGVRRVRLLEAVLVRDVAWAELGRMLRVSDKTARDRAVEAIEALADWRNGRAVAPPPETRFRNEPGRW